MLTLLSSLAVGLAAFSAVLLGGAALYLIFEKV